MNVLAHGVASVDAPSFYGGSPDFNFLSFWITAVGTIVTVGGFALAFWQLRRVAKSADAARDAADQARDQIASVSAVMDTTALVYLAQEVITYIRHDNYAAAAIRAHDLRSGVAKFRKTDVGTAALQPEEWQRMVTLIAAVNEQMTDMILSTTTDVTSGQATLNFPVPEPENQLHWLHDRRRDPKIERCHPLG